MLIPLMCHGKYNLSVIGRNMMNRRKFMTSALVAAVTTAVGSGIAKAREVLTPWEWSDMHGLANHMRKDKNPLANEFEKYPRCPYCGMVRKKWSHTRHLIQYDDDHVDGTCSIRCLSISMALNIDRGPRSIWVGDAGSNAEIKPLVEADKAYYAVQHGKMGTMTGNRKWAYTDKAKAETAGGMIMDFDAALQEAYVDLGKSAAKIRKRRAEKRAHMARKMKNMQHR
jgi:nitrous oxide reductase accessory protein NosL